MISLASLGHELCACLKTLASRRWSFWLSGGLSLSAAASGGWFWWSKQQEKKEGGEGGENEEGVAGAPKDGADGEDAAKDDGEEGEGADGAEGGKKGSKSTLFIIIAAVAVILICWVMNAGGGQQEEFTTGYCIVPDSSEDLLIGKPTLDALGFVSNQHAIELQREDVRFPTILPAEVPQGRAGGSPVE